MSVFQINRLEGQVSRYKSASDNSEKVEDELKAEKRKLQREVTKTKNVFLPQRKTQQAECDDSPLFPPTAPHGSR